MKITIMTSTGDDNPIDKTDGDLEYRKKQLERLQKEVVDIEDMSEGISIMDLGLNEFRLDLLAYIKNNPNVDKAPNGMHAIIKSNDLYPAGVIYVLRNIRDEVNINNSNRLHPFYIVYITMDGEIYSNHLHPKKTLDLLRALCRGKDSEDKALCDIFNKETDDGKNMKEFSKLLELTITSIMDVNDDSDINSLFSGGGTTALLTHFEGLNDFELISFFVIK